MKRRVLHFQNSTFLISRSQSGPSAAGFRLSGGAHVAAHKSIIIAARIALFAGDHFLAAGTLEHVADV